METFENNTGENIWKGFDETIDKWFLVSHPGPVLLIAASYLLFVTKLGPEIMKKRKPFNLKNAILLYNTFQVLVSFCIFWRGIVLLRQTGLIHSVCELKDDALLPVASIIHLYFTAKFIELLDTVFFVLRKKSNQVTFLHVYHHTMVFLGAWWNIKYEPTYSTIFLGTLNSGVHVIMYTYYALSVFPSLTQYLWWKKYLTSLQLIQFLMIMIQVSANYYFSGCPPSYFLFTAIIVNLFLMIYLFRDFYVKSYKEKEVKKPLNGFKNESLSKGTDSFSNGFKTINNHKLFEKIH